MSKTIKIADGTRVIVDGEVYDFKPFGFDEACEAIHIPEECKQDLFRELFCRRRIDLSEAYTKHTVIMELIPPTEDENESEEE